MAQTGYTPIQLYYSTTGTNVPVNTSLLPGEPAINIADTDMSLYFENASGTVKLFFNNPAALKYPTADGTNGQAIITNGAGVLSFTSIATLNSPLAVIGNNTEGASIRLPEDTDNGSSYVALKAPNALAANATLTIPELDGATLGFLNIPQSGIDKTTSYQLDTVDIGKVVVVGTGGSITVPDSVFANGDAVLLYNNTAADVTLTMSITTAYIAGTNTDKATITLATRGLANVLFISGTVCVVTGNVS